MTVIETMKARGIIPRAALYARFSSDNQREESIDAQLRAMREYCKRNKVVIAVFTHCTELCIDRFFALIV